MSRLDDQITNEMIQLVNENAEMYRIAEYIVSKHDGIFIDDAREYAKYLVKTAGFTKNEILSGKADKSISNWVRGMMLAKNSVFQQDETPQETPLKTKKEKISPTNYKKRVIIFVAGVAVVIYIVVNLVGFAVTNIIGIKDNIEQIKLETSVSQSIGMLASASGNDAYEHKMNIISQNAYPVPGSFNSDGSPVIAYRNEDIAADIIKVCSHNPDLFDLCVQDAYFNMSKNRLGNMDDVLRWLQIYSEDKEDLQYIYEQVKDCDIFIEYLVKEGFISPNNEDYPLLEAAIKEYKTLREYNSPFSALSKEHQKVIENLIDEYEENKSISYPKFAGILKELVELDRKGGR